MMNTAGCKAVVIALMLLVLSWPCLAAEPPPRQARPGLRIITVPKGKVFKVTLPSNPSTGYQWALASMPDSKVVQLLGNRYLPPTKEKPPMGAPGRTVWSFKAVGPGKETIVLHYLRSWEKDKPPIKVRKVAVEVR